MTEDSLSKFLGKRPAFLDLPKSSVNVGYASNGSVRRVSPRVQTGMCRSVFSAVAEVERPVLEGDDLWTRWQLNSKILHNKNLRKYFMYPVRDDVFKDIFIQAGRGKVTVPNGSYACGSYKRSNVCDNVEGHKGKLLDGDNVEGKYVVGVETISCDRLQCPTCFLSHAVRVAKSVAARLETASEKGYGVVEHGTISPDAGLVFEFHEKFGKSWEDELWKYYWGVLKSVGVSGAVMVRHARRVDKERRDLYGSHHYHFCGFLSRFDCCRGCETRDKRRGISPDCRNCGGFMARVLRGNDNGNRCIVRVFEARKSVAATISYIASHASQRLDVKRDHAVRYFGCVANCRFKSKPIDKRIRCAVCGHEVRHDLRYVGHRNIVRNVWEPLFKSFVAVEPVDGVTGLANFVDEARFVDEGGGGR